MKITFLKVLFRYTGKLLNLFFLEILLSIATFLFFIMPWLVDNFGDSLSIDQIIVNIVPEQEGNNELILKQLHDSFIRDVATPSLIFDLFFNVVFFIDRIALFSFSAALLSCMGWLRDLIKPLFFFKRHLFSIICLILIYSCFQIYSNISGFGFIAAFFPTFTHKIESHNVKRAKINFGEDKRNLIFIFLESMEATYKNKGVVGVNLMPMLSELQENNFSVEDHPQTAGSHYTMGAIISYLCGFPPPSFEDKNNKELNRSRCLTDILARNGYNMFFIRGASATFGGFKSFTRRHHLAGKIAGIDEIREIDPNWSKYDSHIGWGVSDSLVYHHAKIKINELAKKENPFAFMLLTSDSHFPDGYVDPSCEKKYGDFRDVISCADTQVGNFVKWIQKQRFAKDTTIVIVSDHLFMGGPFHKAFLKFNKNKRKNFNVIINPIKEFRTENRTISHVDFLPTVIEALGGSIEGGRLGLGTSLFSDKKTLIEELGKSKMDSLLFYYCVKNTKSIKGKASILHEHK